MERQEGGGVRCADSGGKSLRERSLAGRNSDTLPCHGIRRCLSSLELSSAIEFRLSLRACRASHFPLPSPSRAVWASPHPSQIFWRPFQSSRRHCAAVGFPHPCGDQCRLSFFLGRSRRAWHIFVDPLRCCTKAERRVAAKTERLPFERTSPDDSSRSARPP